MLREYKKFKCKHCGHKFIGPDFELGATVFTAPVECPHCGCTTDQVIGPAILENLKMILRKISE